MDDRHFDDLTRRVGAMGVPVLPRRGLLRLLGSGALAGALGLSLTEPDQAGAAKNKDKNTKCKKEGKKCDKKKCKKQDKKCCCSDLKCNDGVCEGKGGTCPTWVSANGALTGTTFRTPWGVATDNDGNVYVTDNGNSRVKVFSQSGGYIDDWGGAGSGQTQFLNLLGIAINAESGKNRDKPRVYVSDPQQSSIERRVRKFTVSGSYQQSLGRSGLTKPEGIAVDSNNNVWVIDASPTGKIFLFDRNGNYRTSWTPSGNGTLSSPEGIAVYTDKDDRTWVYVTNTGSSRVVRYEFTSTSSSGLAFDKFVGGVGSGSTSFNTPVGITADACGNIWVADQFNNRVQILDKNLAFVSRFEAGFSRPTGVALSPNGKLLFVADSNNNRVQRYSLSTSRPQQARALNIA